MALASTNYQAQITSIQERAKKYNERVLQIRERRSSNERAQGEKVQTELSQKLTQAEERLAQKLNSRKERAKRYNEKAKERV